MKPALLFVTVSLFISFHIQAQNVGIGNTSPAAQLSVGSSSQFRVNNVGDLIRIKNLAYTFPTAHGADQYLRNDGAGNLTWAPANKPVVRAFLMTTNGSDWLIDQPSDYASGSNADPTLVLHRGFTYHFINNSGGHPFYITNTPGMGGYGVGVTNNGMGSGAIIFTVPMDAPSTLYYYCSIHPAMNGTITIQ